jgi:WD40 repeat protein
MINDHLIAAGLFNGQIKIYDLIKSETIKTISAHKSFVNRLKYLSSDGKLLSGAGKGEIKLWKISK